MIRVRRSAERGHFDHGWLRTFHTFSFARYFDPEHVRFRALRVMNEDYIRAGAGFGTHGHEDMEIITYVLEGELAHTDSLGHTAVLPPGEFQRMTAGTGIEHSEFNPSKERAVHLYQIWIEPDRLGRTPEYEQRRFDDSLSEGGLGLVASPGGAEGGLNLNADARIHHGRFGEGGSAAIELGESRFVWVQVLRGEVEIEGERLEAGDGAAVWDLRRVEVVTPRSSEVLCFDLG